MRKGRLVGIATLLSFLMLLFGTVADAHWRIHDYEKKLGLIRLHRYQFLPPVAIRDLKGNPFSLYEFRGEVILLNFWSRLCVVSTEELEVLQQIHESLEEAAINLGASRIKTIMSINAKKIETAFFPILIINF